MFILSGCNSENVSSEEPKKGDHENHQEQTSNEGMGWTHGHLEKSTDTSSNDQKATEEKVNAEETKTSSNNVPLYLSIAALIVGLLALFISFKKRG